MEPMSQQVIILIVFYTFFSFDFTVATGNSIQPFVPTLDTDTNSPLCSVDPPSAVLSMTDLVVGIPLGVPESVVCSYGCTGYGGCTSFNYRKRESSSWCELYTYNVRNCMVATNETCHYYQVLGLQPPSCRIPGGWSNWTTNATCETPGQKKSLRIRYCNNPTPKYGGSLCITSTGALSLIEFSQSDCACDAKCKSGCIKQGGQKCDSACFTGYGITSSYTCVACNSPYCVTSCNNYGPGTCDGPCTSGASLNPTTHICNACDVQCSSGCVQQGQGKCDSSCNTGFGITAGKVCHACNTSNCAGSCNNNGLGTCDGPCSFGYWLNPASHVCDPCNSANCAGSCNYYGPGTCDGPCSNGYMLDYASHVCHKPCPSGYSFRSPGNSCYKFVDTVTDHASAQRDCVNDTAHLVWIESQAEEADLTTLLTPGNGGTVYWPTCTGGCRTTIDSPGTFVWSYTCDNFVGVTSGSSKALSYVSWLAGEPNNAGYSSDTAGSGEFCIGIVTLTVGSEWNDFSCSSNNCFYICEYDV